MKKLFSLFTLLVAIVMGAWATDETISWSGSSLTGTSGTNVTAGTATAVNGSTYKAGTLSISSSKIQTESKKHTNDSYWEDFSSGTQGETSTNATTTARIEFPITIADGYSFNVTGIDFKLEQGGGGGPAVHVFLVQGTTSTWIGYTTAATKAYTSLDIDLSAGSAKLVFVLGVASNLNNGRQFKLSGIAIKGTSVSVGPVDPVFELSADEVEVGKTINVNGPTGLEFTATAVDGTAGAVSVDGGTITGVTAGAAQVRVTSAATDDYNAYDNTFDITVTAAKIATELSFGTPTTTVARGEEVTNAATLTAGGEAISGTVTYSSDNESVATVDATGKVTGVKVGTANIKANFAGDATYSAAEEISYAITVTLPALTAVDNKFWTSASLLSEAGGAKDYTTADVLDNMEIAGTSTALKITAGGDKTIDGQTFGGRVRFGKDGTAAGNYLHFMVKPNTKITMWGIRATAGAESNGLALSIGAVGNEEEVYSFAGGDVEYMTYIYTGSEDADMYAYSKATAGASMMAIKVEPIQSTTINLNSKGFATYSSKYDFTFDGADAYGMKLTETSLVGTKVTSGKVKAGEGILFKGEAGATVTITETTGAEAIGDANNLIGTTNASEDIISSSAAYKYALSGDTFLPFIGTLKANKAFFGSDTVIANSLDMVFEDEATAINGVNANENLNVNVPVKVIKNGQLVIETANGVFTAAGAQVK